MSHTEIPSSSSRAFWIDSLLVGYLVPRVGGFFFCESHRDSRPPSGESITTDRSLSHIQDTAHSESRVFDGNRNSGYPKDAGCTGHGISHIPVSSCVCLWYVLSAQGWKNCTLVGQENKLTTSLYATGSQSTITQITEQTYLSLFETSREVKYVVPLALEIGLSSFW